MNLDQTETPRTAGAAIASLVLGILSLTCFSILTGIPALILGIVALAGIGRSAGALRGQGLAIAGIITGCLSILLLPIVAAIALPAIVTAKQQAQSVVCLNNVKICSVACQQYVLEHGGALPKQWDDLQVYLAGGPGMEKVLVCPMHKGAATRDYELLHGGEKLDAIPNRGETIIIREIQSSHHGRRALGFADGHAEMRADP